MYLTPNQVYKKYGYHPKSLARWADEGKIKCTRSLLPLGYADEPIKKYGGRLSTERVCYGESFGQAL